MSVFKKFEKSYLARYNNSLHAAYHTAQLKQLQAVGEETLEGMHVSGELLEGYAMTVDDLTERSMELLFRFRYQILFYLPILKKMLKSLVWKLKRKAL